MAETITLTEIRSTPDGVDGEARPNASSEVVPRSELAALLSFSHGGTYQVSITVPGDRELEALHDEFLRDGVSTADIERLGRKLFLNDLRRVIPHADAGEEEDDERLHQIRMDWDRVLRDNDEHTLVIEGNRRIHRIPWEFLAVQPNGRLPQRTPIVRKLTGYAPPPHDAEAHPLRILLVTARPYGPVDISHRHVAERLLRQRSVKENWPSIDVLRGGGTIQQLARRLAERKYQVVHFDMHGELRDGEGFLLFESDGSLTRDLVPAENVARLLLDHGVQLALFTSCDSARPASLGSSIGRSLAHEVARHGVPATVGMSQPISADGAQHFSEFLYSRLFEQQADQSVASAVAAAKVDLDRHLNRQDGDVAERREEWRIPSLWLRSNPDFSVTHVDAGKGRIDRIDVRDTFEARGFRDFDHRLVDRLLFQNNRPVLVRGLRGTGKKAFLRDLETWWKLAAFARTHVVLRLRDADETLATLEATFGVEFDDPEEPTEEELKLLKDQICALAAGPDGDGRRDGEVIFYLHSIDAAETPRAIVQRIVETAGDPQVHAVASARARPGWLAQADIEEFDMLWLNSQAAREVFQERAGRADDLLIAACSDLPGVIKQFASRIRPESPESARQEKTPKFTTTYFDEVLPFGELVRDLTKAGVVQQDIHPFGGIKGFPLPLVEYELLEFYLMDCHNRELLRSSPEELLAKLTALGLLTPLPAHGENRTMLRLHPYLPLAARRSLRKELKCDGTKVKLNAMQRKKMDPLTASYDVMTSKRHRSFRLLTSGRRVERWHLDRSPVVPVSPPPSSRLPRLSGGLKRIWPSRPFVRSSTSSDRR